MTKLVIIPKPLTNKNFAKFGEVISAYGDNFSTINNGFAKKYANLANIDTSETQGISALHIFLTKKRDLPLTINMLENHPFSSQTFIPRHNKPFLIVVAPVSTQPVVDYIEAFITNGGQGVSYSRGIWHFPLISITDNAEFIVIDRMDSLKTKSKLADCIIYNFASDCQIVISS